MSGALGLGDAAEAGRNAAARAMIGKPASTTGSGAAQTASTGTPDWARQLRSEQAARHHRQTAAQTLKEGDGGGASATPDISEKED